MQAERANTVATRAIDREVERFRIGTTWEYVIRESFLTFQVELPIGHLSQMATFEAGHLRADQGSQFGPPITSFSKGAQATFTSSSECPRRDAKVWT